MDTAAGLAGLNVDLFRAGVWKPRTRPGNFEGAGSQAFEWLKEAQLTYGIKVAVEVAEPLHIEEALKNGMDVIWIGARTTVNPFQVQALAEALQGVSIPVMVKNPVNPDVELWIGAIERFEKAGIVDIAAIHRGFSGYSPANGYRNQPNWLIPIELKRRRPDLPIFCDPSHISGDRDRVADVAQKALDLHFDGLMIEAHNDPVHAWSDAAQQITPARLGEILDNLIFREEFTADMGSKAILENYRHQMDTLDAEIIDLIARRMELSEQIGHIKKDCNLTVFQPNRWREIVDTCNNRAGAHNLDAAFIIEIYEKIHHESIRTQLSVFEQQPNEIKK